MNRNLTVFSLILIGFLAAIRFVQQKRSNPSLPLTLPEAFEISWSRNQHVYKSLAQLFDENWERDKELYRAAIDL